MGEAGKLKMRPTRTQKIVMPGDVLQKKISLAGVRRGSIMSTGPALQCARCRGPFKELMGTNGDLVEGCEACWKQNNYEGPVPTEVLEEEMGTVSAKVKVKLERRMSTFQHQQQDEGDKRTETLVKRLEVLKSKEPMKRALLAMVKQIQSRGLSELELFNAIDQDGNGTLERGELMAALRKLGVKLSALELDGILRAVDQDGNGTIDYQEFYFLLKSEGDAAMTKPSEHDPRLMGFGLGEKVRIKVALWTESERHRRSSAFRSSGKEVDVGTVMGPGMQPGTLLVKYDRDDSLVNFKPIQLVRMSADELAKHAEDCVCAKCLNDCEYGEDTDTDDDDDDS